MRKWAAAAMALAAGGVGALAAREAWQRRQDQQAFEEGRNYWRTYTPAEMARWAEAHGTSQRIPSYAAGIHLDVYAQAANDAPVLVLAHGLLTYGKYLIPLARAFYDRGYTVLCPDLGGSGFSGGVRGATSVGEATAALVDTTIWARRRFDGSIAMLGLSLGGALAYAAAAAGAPVSAIACLDLFTFDDPAAFRQIIARPALLDALPVLRAIAVPFGWVRVPVTWVHRVAGSVAPAESGDLTVLRNDPLARRQVALRALISAVTTPPAVPLAHNTVPTLVFNQADDAVLAPEVTRAAYLRLGGPKRYIDLPNSAHWSAHSAFWEPIVRESDRWFHEHQPMPLRQSIDQTPSGASSL